MNLSKFIYEVRLDDYLTIINEHLKYAENKNIDKSIVNEFINDFKSLKEILPNNIPGGRDHRRFINILLKFFSKYNIYTPIYTLFILINALHYNYSTELPINDYIRNIRHLCTYHDIYPLFIETTNDIVIKAIKKNKPIYEQFANLIVDDS